MKRKKGLIVSKGQKESAFSREAEFQTKAWMFRKITERMKCERVDSLKIAGAAAAGEGEAGRKPRRKVIYCRTIFIC